MYALKNKVVFNPTSKMAELSVPPPKPARNYLPEWYKKMNAFDTKKPEFNEYGGVNFNVKMCMPFADSFSAGYIQESWQDIYIESEQLEDGSFNIKYFYPTKPEIISYRNEVSIPTSDKFYNAEFVFHPAWVPELPSGWSMLYVNPFNRMDLPFNFLSGIVDADKFKQSEYKSNIPFYINKPFSGLVPKGTPLIQMIPIKRESWSSEISSFNENEQAKITEKVRQHFWGGYKKMFWQKKEYS